MSRATIIISRRGRQKYNDAIADSVSLKTQQFLVTHTIRQTEIPGSLDSWLQASLLSHSCVHNSTVSPYIFVKN
jgi:hypothetical protein